jgi:hypothetical protein
MAQEKSCAIFVPINAAYAPLFQMILTGAFRFPSLAYFSGLAVTDAFVLRLQNNLILYNISFGLYEKNA